MNIKNIREVLTMWYKAEEKLFFRCIPFREVEEDGLYKKIGDIALVPYIRICEDDEVAFADVSKDMVDIWRVPEKAVWMEATYNSQNEVRYATLGFKELLGLNMKLRLHKDISHEMITSPFIVSVTNKDTHFGAANIFLPGVADKLCKAFEVDSLLIGFTSQHEAIVHANDGNTDPREISLVLHDMDKMASEIERIHGSVSEHVLSTHVFKYEDKKFSVIA